MKYSYNYDYDAIICEPTCAIEALREAMEIADDYDGYTEAKDLIKLIDELCGYISNACNMILEGKVQEIDVQEETRNSWKEAYRILEARS